MIRRINLSVLLWILAGLAGFVAVFFLGWRVFYDWLVPQAAGISGLPVGGVVGFSLLAGTLSFFSPCPFSVFPSYVGYFLAADKSNPHPPVSSAVRFALRASAGILLFYLVLGAILAALGTQLAVWVNYIKIGVIVVIFLLGAVLIFERQLPTGYLDRLTGWFGLKARGENKGTGSFLYGIVYAIAGAACFLPILLVIALTPILTGEFTTGLLAFVSYGVAIAATLTVATILVALGKQKILMPVLRNATNLKRVSGVLLILTAIYLTGFYAIAGM